MIFPGFVGPSYVAASPNANAERCINRIPEVIDSGTGKAQIFYRPSPGVRLFGTMPTSPTRGLFSLDGRLWTVAANGLLEVDAAGVSTVRGAVVQSAAPVSWASNGDAGEQLLVASGRTGYILDTVSNGLTAEVAEVDVVGYLGSYFVALDARTSTLKWCDPIDGTTWNALSEARRLLAADRWTGLIVVQGQILLYGSETSEFWYPTGDPDDPFAPNTGGVLEVGIAATWSARKIGTSAYWLGQTADGGPSVYRTEGLQAARISTHAVEHAIGSYATVSDAIGWSYAEGGHTFYVLQFPTAGATWCYDLTTGWWTERATWDARTGMYTAWRPQFHARAFGKAIVGDRLTGALYEMSTGIYTDVDGSGVRWARRMPHLSNEERPITYARLQIDVEAGVGLTTGQGSDPQLMLRYSNDGGKTWSSERWAAIGARGKYGQRAVWRALGRGRDRVFELTGSDPVPVHLVNAYLEAGQ